jgi:predicted metal-dependent hydrolase
MERLKLGNVVVEVTLKDIKNIHLSVYPPTGHVKVAAPSRMRLDVIRAYVISKLGWIRKRQTKFRNQEREAPRDYVSRESHYYLGKRYLLKVVEVDAPPKIILKHRTIVMQVRPGTSKAKRKFIMDQWYRSQLKEIVTPLISKWEKRMKVRVAGFGIRKMKTKWGSCNTDAKRILLNLELVKKPIHIIEYIVVHELIHLKERKHNAKFQANLDVFLPDWRALKERLNILPL